MKLRILTRGEWERGVMWHKGTAGRDLEQSGCRVCGIPEGEEPKEAARPSGSLHREGASL